MRSIGMMFLLLFLSSCSQIVGWRMDRYLIGLVCIRSHYLSISGTNGTLIEKFDNIELIDLDSQRILFKTQDGSVHSIIKDNTRYKYIFE